MSSQHSGSDAVPPRSVLYLTQNPLIQIRSCAAGNGAFASQDLFAGTTLIESNRPEISLITSGSRQETCAWCFKHNLGGWKIRFSECLGLLFCSEYCRKFWKSKYGEEGLEAFIAAFYFILPRSSRIQDDRDNSQSLDTTSVDRTWAEVEEQAKQVRKYRNGERVSPNTALKIGQNDQDAMMLVLDGILCRAFRPEDWRKVETLKASVVWTDSFSLGLATRAFLHLSWTLPLNFLERDYLSRAVVERILSVYWTNAFSVDETNTSGLWSDASFFNHACEGAKEYNTIWIIEGRHWRAYATRDVKQGEELCVCYIGAMYDAGVKERRRQLRRLWGFVCHCSKCEVEAQATKRRT